MKNFLSYIDGNKTYIVAILVAGATFSKIVGWITETEFQAILGFLGAIGLYTVRDAVRKLE